MNAVTRVGENVEKIDVPANENPVRPAAPVAPAPTAAPAPAPQPKPKRRWLRWLLMVIVPLVLVVGGGYYWITGGRIQETDNANLRQPRISIASEEAGRVIEVDIAENAKVHAGDVLFRVDPEPYRIALDQADAAIAAARLNVEQLRAAYSQAIAQEQIAAQNVAFLKAELDRQTELSRKGITTQTALDQARRDLANAQQQEAGAKQGIAAARAALGGNPDIETDKHPTVLSALAARDKAQYAFDQTTVRAPADGVITQASSFKVGEYVAPGTPLFMLVETGENWVEANFKETQLTHMHAGQSAEIVIDTYPERPLRATVEAIGAGTGAEFSLLPAQNATGNWVKVTQRIPVRLRITDDRNLPLRTGMSATVSVDTGVSRGLPKWLGGRAVAAE